MSKINLPTQNHKKVTKINRKLEYGIKIPEKII